MGSMYEGTLADNILDTDGMQHQTDYYLDGAKVSRLGLGSLGLAPGQWGK